MSETKGKFKLEKPTNPFISDKKQILDREIPPPGDEIDQIDREKYETSAHLEIPDEFKETFFTPERIERLTRISEGFTRGLQQRFGVERSIYDPRLIFIEERITREKRGGYFHQQIEGGHVGMVRRFFSEEPKEEFPLSFIYRKINDNSVNTILVHELGHVHAENIWQTEESGQTPENELTRTGLHFFNRGVDSWGFMDERLTESYKNETFFDLTGEQSNYRTYGKEIKIGDGIVGGLAKKHAAQPKEVDEELYRVKFGAKPLARLKTIIGPEFHSVKDFIAMTDMPYTFFGGKGSLPIYEKLSEEIGDGNAQTTLQRSLLEFAENNTVIGSQFRILREYLKRAYSEDPNSEKIKLAAENLIEFFNNYPALNFFAMMVLNDLERVAKKGFYDDEHYHHVRGFLLKAKELLPIAIYARINAAASELTERWSNRRNFSEDNLKSDLGKLFVTQYAKV